MWTSHLFCRLLTVSIIFFFLTNRLDCAGSIVLLKLTSRYIMTTRLYKWPLYPGNPNVIGPLTLTFDLVSNLGLSSHASATYSKSFDLCAPRRRHASHRGHVTCVLNLYHAEVIVTWVKIQRSRVLFNVIEHVSLISYTSALHHLIVCDA